MTALSRLMLLTVLVVALAIWVAQADPHAALEQNPEQPHWDFWISAGPDDGMYPRQLHLYVDSGGYWYLRAMPIGEWRGCVSLVWATDSCEWPRG